MARMSHQFIARRSSRSTLALLLFASSLFAGGPASRPSPPAKPAPAPAAAEPKHPDPDHETDRPGWRLPAHPVARQALRFQDPAVAELAGKIADGSADMIERRAWHMLALNYAPFTDLPPAHWRQRARADGERISLKSRRSGAAPLLGEAGVPAPELPLATYGWSSLGPTNYGNNQGRATTLWVHPTNPNFIFAGFAGGGVWKTTNGGTNWTPLTDFEASLGVGSMDVLVRADTVNLSDAILYVGTGEGNTSFDTVDGAGVLKSVDGGASWTLQPLPWANPDYATSGRFRHSIRRVLIDRNVANGQSVWAAADGGVYRTTNGGSTWTLVTGLPYTGKPGVGGCWPEVATDLVVDSSVSPARFYVAYGMRANGSAVAALSCTGVANDSNFRKNNGIYRSLDGGATWTDISRGATQTGFPALPGNVGRISLLSAPSDRKQAYALIQCATNGASACANGNYSSLGIFRTADLTATPVVWTAGSTTNYVNNQGWYDMTGSVDPTNPAKVLLQGFDVYLSTNNLASFTTKSGPHVDHHFSVYYNANTVFVASDGGIWKGAVNNTVITWTPLNGGGLSTLQFYGIGQDPVIANKMHGGLQDNGEAYTAGTGTWSSSAGGDGGMSATDQSNGNYAYEEYVYAAISRSTNGGSSYATCIQNFGGVSGCGGSIPDGQCAFIAPFVLDANNQATMYAGCKFVYRNTNARSTSTWTAISPDLVGTTYDYINNVHSAPNNGVAGTIWAATLNGKVWVTTNGGTNWTDTTKNPLPGSAILPARAATWVATDPRNGAKALVAFSGWSGATAAPGHLFRTLDGGATWTDITGQLPDEPFYAIAVDPARPNEAYAGSEFGVYLNANVWGGSNWTKINNGQMPHVHVHQLEFSRANGKLRAATHGRGIWELTVTRPAAKPVPDGAFIAGAPLRAGKGAAGAITVTFDASTCNSGGYNAYWGALSPAALAVMTYSGEECAISSGNAIHSIPAATSAFFVVAGTDGGANESGHTQNSAGAWRGSGTGRCGVTAQSTGMTCP